MRWLLNLVNKDRYQLPLSFYIHVQRDGWGFGWLQDGKRMFFFHGRYGPWVNLSESHTSRNCTDHAYCPHHGAL